MMCSDGTIESGALLPVLQAATHEELAGIIDALNQGADIFVKKASFYREHQHDLTKAPALIAITLCQAGGHSLRNVFRGGKGPDYRVVLEDVCAKFNVKKKVSLTNLDLEEALLKEVLDRVIRKLPPEKRDEVLKQAAAASGRPVDIADVLGSGFNVIAGMILPIVLEVSGLFGAEAAAAATVGAIAGPLIPVLGLVALAHNFAGPSFRATIPAVIQVAIIRQRLLWRRAR